MNSSIECKIIKNKKIYIFESHHHALYPWCELRESLYEAPVLLSPDHHTDTHSPFISASTNYNTLELNEDRIKELLDKIDFNDIKSIDSIIHELKNDEHIKTSIEKDIISKALIISYSNYKDEPLSKEESNRIKNFKEIHLKKILGQNIDEYNIMRPYNYPKSEIYIPAIDEENRETKELYDLAIEEDFLKEKFNIFNEMVPDIVSKELNEYRINKKYILDIDLDYFHTLKSIRISNINFFYELIRNAEIITIAKESVCVDLLKFDKEDINSNLLCEELLMHIEKALDYDYINTTN